MYRMAVAAFALPPPVSAHAMKLALVHDLAEALVKDVDKYEMVVQAYEYEKATGKDLSPFFDSTAGKFRTPTVRGWAEPVYAARAAARAAAAAAAGEGGGAPPQPPAGSPP